MIDFIELYLSQLVHLPVVCNLLEYLMVLPSVSVTIPRQYSASEGDSLKAARACLIIADLVNIISLSCVRKQYFIITTHNILH